MASEPAADPEAVVFRPSKKRKIYRRRASNASDDENAANSISPPPAQSLDELIASSAHAASEAESGLSVAEILRLRKQRKPKTGVEFKALGSLVRNDDGELVEKKEGKEQEGEVAGGGRRFAPQTGTVADVNKHMMAYIDSELAKRRTAEAPSGAQATMSNAFVREGAGLAEVKRADKEANRQPAAIGKLMEIDLGDEVRSRNIEQTERARRRLEGEEVVDEEVVTKPVKVRLGPDGKPWRSKKRRGSDDIKRDKLVEEILRENRLEIYDELPPEPEIKDDQAADDRIAEAFRKEFMDSQRERKKPAPAPPPSRNPAKRKEEEELKGPKLGGSRSARAAMKEAMLKQSKK